MSWTNWLRGVDHGLVVLGVTDLTSTNGKTDLWDVLETLRRHDFKLVLDNYYLMKAIGLDEITMNINVYESL